MITLAFFLETRLFQAGDIRWLVIALGSLALLVIWIAVAYLLDRRREKRSRQARRTQRDIDKMDDDTIKNHHAIGIKTLEVLQELRDYLRRRD